LKCKYDHCRFHEVHGLTLKHDQVDEETYCEFHLPLFDSGGKKTSKSKYEASNSSFNERVICAINYLIENNLPVDLFEIVFPGGIKFRGVKFKGHNSKDINFINCIFYSRADFSSLSVFGKLKLANCKFKDAVNFKWCRLEGELIINDSEFHSTTIFKNASFSRHIQIINTKFIGIVDFSVTSNTESKTNESWGNFPSIYFNNSSFGDEVFFINRRFLKTTDFNDCTFNAAPKFQGCLLHEDTTFPPEKNFPVIGNQESASAYRTLKLAMEKIRARNEEAMFSALEQKCIHLNPNTPKSFKTFSWLYGVTTDYGQSVWHVFRSFLITLFSFFIIYLWIATPTIDPSLTFDFKLIFKVFIFNLKQTIPPYHAYNSRIPDWLGSGPNDDFLEIIFNLQTTLNLALLALLVLVLRWRFKRG